MSNQEKEEEEIFRNPGLIEEIQRRKEERQAEKRRRLLDPTLAQQKEKRMFDEQERTEHKDIAPAKDRVGAYQRKSFGKLFQNFAEARPLSAAASSGGLAEVTTQAASVFEEDEKSLRAHPFKHFFTTGEPVVFRTQNRFEGRSNFYSYFPTEDAQEQRVERAWFEGQNKQLQDKRRQEELKQTVKEWSDAKQRLEAEIQRKKEHLNAGTKFEARGFVRSNWKTKNFNPRDNPLLEESSSEDDEAERAQEVEEYDEEDAEEDEEEIREDEDFDGDEQEHQMKSLERRAAGRPAKSALPGLRPQKTTGGLAKPKLHDLTQDQVAYGMRPSTAVQLQQIQKITEFNQALPPRKRPTSSLPMIQACNIGSKDLVKKDHKKKTVEIVTKYNPVGFVDDYIDPSEDGGSKFSMLGKVRSLSTQAAKQRIQTVRKHSG